MTKKGFVLVFALILEMVLIIILGAIFSKAINENNLVKRHLYNMRAFWVAEAGVAQAIRNFPNSPLNGIISTDTYNTTTAFWTVIASRNYYNLCSIGTVNLPSGATLTRRIDVVARGGLVDASKFQYAVQAANDLCFGGNCKKDPYGYIHPGAGGCDGHDCYKEFDNSINFADQFGQQLSAVSALATHYTDANFPGAVSGVNWIDVSAGGKVMITGSQQGSGILIVNGNVEFAGSYQFDGIIYVLGTLTARGTCQLRGSVVVASTSSVDSINGTPDLTWDITKITNALNQLALINVDMVSWQETP